MKTFRKTLFWSHLVVGITAGIVMLVMSVTGVLPTYEKQMSYWWETRGFNIAPSTPLPPEGSGSIDDAANFTCQMLAKK